MHVKTSLISHADFPPDEVRELAASHSDAALISTVDKPLPKQFRLEGPSLHMQQ